MSRELATEEKQQEVIRLCKRLQESSSNNVIFRQPLYVAVNKLYRFNILGVWVSLMGELHILTGDFLWRPLSDAENGGVEKALDVLYVRLLRLDQKRTETFN